MNNRILSLLETFRTSFWFIPSTMVASSSVLASLFLAYDRSYKDFTPDFLKFIYKTSPESVRALLTTIAGSMITVTSIAFSITVVALSLASSQFGPRLIRNFMSDKGTQSVLGVFVAIFTYCLLVLQATTSIGTQHFIPGLATYFALVLAFAGVGVLIYFIHHVAHSIQADNVIDKVYCQLKLDIERLFPAQKTQVKDLDNGPLSYSETRYSQGLKSQQDGYIQAIDIERLIQLATENEIKIKVLVKAGDAVVKGFTLMKLGIDDAKEQPDEQTLLACIMVGAKRTPIQDPEFAINQLVEIAVRALSPGINDPFTAITCTDKLCAILCALTQRTYPPSKHKDQQGTIRVITHAFQFSQLAHSAFNQIRQYAEGSVAVTIRLLESLQLIADLVSEQDQREFVEQQRDMIAQASERQSLCKQDKQDIEQRLKQISESLGKGGRC
jgi:uncharacterized membrane protein